MPSNENNHGNVDDGTVMMTTMMTTTIMMTMTMTTIMIMIITHSLLAYQVGVFVVYFLDYTLGSAWWVMVLYLIQVISMKMTMTIMIMTSMTLMKLKVIFTDLFFLQLFAVFMVRGKPYGSQQVASLLFPKKVRW